MIVGIPKESSPGERRVALVPAQITALSRKGHTVRVERGAGTAAGFPDAEYEGKGAQLASRGEVFDAAVILGVRGAGASLETGAADIEQMKADQTLIAFLDPLSEPGALQPLVDKNIRSFSMELIPRITRAQSMDALSSMATVSGYKAVLMAADHLPRMFPMLMTAAGTVTPARVFVMGAGVAGLQAIATARRLGAVVRAYDVRPVVKEQVESLGARFVELPLDTEGAEGAGGYAKEQSEDFLRRQRELMLEVVSESDVVITTAAIPGRKAPILVTEEMVEAMPPGTVIVDLAAERGGNCALTHPGETHDVHGVTILGPLNVPSMVPYHASQMYSKNIATLLLHLTQDGELALDHADEIVAGTLVTEGGEVVHPRIRELLGLPPATTHEEETAGTPPSGPS